MTRPRQALTATPHRYGQMGSFGKAQYMLIRQSKFPDTYDEKDKVMNADSDRLSSWDYEHTNAAFERRTGTGPLGIEHWAESAKVTQIMEFLIDVLKADEQYPDTKWTGFRIMGTVAPNGYPVWTFELFAKARGTKTKVYSNGRAPNVHRLGWRASQAEKDAARNKPRKVMVEPGGMVMYLED